MKKRTFSIPPSILFLFVLLAVIFIVSMAAPLIYPVDLGASNLIKRLKPPSIFGLSNSGYILGTDYLGRDVWIRLLYATRTSLIITFTGLFFASILGTLLGVLSGLFGGRIDDLVNFLVSARNSIPSLIIGLVASTIFGASEKMIIILIACVQWSGFARQSRAMTLQIKNENFIDCSRALGASYPRIIREHILRNIASPLIVTATMNISGTIMLESSLSFLGLGIQPPMTSLGVMVANGRNYMLTNWWLAIIPSAMIVIIVLSVALIGDWLRDRLDKKNAVMR